MPSDAMSGVLTKCVASGIVGTHNNASDLVYASFF